MAGSQRADTHDVHVVVDRLLGCLARRLEQRTDVDVEAEVGKRRGDDLLTTIVAVLAHLGDQDTGRRPSAAAKLSTRSRARRTLTGSPTSLA